MSVNLEQLRRVKRLIPPGAREDFIAVGSGYVRLLSAGVAAGKNAGVVVGSPANSVTNPPVLLIHGGGTDNASISWYRLFEPLSAQYRVLAFDLPGFGATIDIEPAGGADRIADFVAEVMAVLGVDRAHIIGVSMGGDVALNLALRQPECVESLILIAPGGLVELFKSKATQYSAYLGIKLPDWLLFFLSGIANRFTKSILKQVVKDISTLPAEVVEEFCREANKPRGGLGYARYNQASIGSDRMLNCLLDDVARISVPTLFFHGQEDPMVDKQGSITAAQRMPDARLILVENCGHWAQLEQHELFLAETLQFLKSR